MKENKRLFWFAVATSIITLILSFIFYSNKNNFLNYISSLSLNIFSGSLILICTSIVYYFVERRRTLQNIMHELILLRNKFCKLKYLDDIDVCSFDVFKKNYCKMYNKKNISNKELKKEYEEYKNNHVNKIYEEMEEIMQQYLEVNKMNLTNLNNLYDNIDYLFGKKLKDEMFYSIFDFTYKLKDKISRACFHFNIYFEDGAGNKFVNYEIVRELQKLIFDYEEKSIDDRSKWSIATDSVFVDHSNFNYFMNIKSIVFNKCAKKYDDDLIKVGKIAYFDKKYNSYDN